MKTRWLSITLLFGGLWATSGCQRDAEKPATPQAPEATNMATKDYPITGRVVSIAPDKSAITLDHEDIPGLMSAMQMPFTVEDPKILEGIEPDSQVEGRLKVDDGKYIITQLKTR
jgi:protein SCO1/2